MNEIKIDNSLSAINKIILPLKNEVMIIMDVHGVIFESTWLKELEDFYVKATNDNSRANIRKWQEECTGKAEGINAPRKMSEILNCEYEEMLSLFLDIQEYHHDLRPPVIKPGVVDFISAVNNDNIPIHLISGSSKERIIDQLKQADIIHLFNPENIHGLDMPFGRKNILKNELIYEIRDRNPDRQMIYFDDWIVGLESVVECEGIIFGMPIGDGNILKQSSEIMSQFGVNYFLYDWNNQEALRSIILGKMK